MKDNQGFGKILIIILIAAGALYFVKDTNGKSMLEKLVMYYPNKFKETNEKVEDLKVQTADRQNQIDEYLK